MLGCRYTHGYNAISVQLKLQLPTGTELDNYPYTKHLDQFKVPDQSDQNSSKFDNNFLFEKHYKN